MRTSVASLVLLIPLATACRSTAGSATAAPEYPASPPHGSASVVEELPAPEPSVTTLEHAFERAAQAVAPAVVSVVVEQDARAQMPPWMRPFGPSGEVRGLGSGVIIDSAGYILTNNHVVEHAQTVNVRLHDDRELRAEVVGTDPKTDLAVIKVHSGGLHAAPLHQGADLRVGQWVLAVGSPFGLTRTVTAGIVSAVGRGSMGITDYGDFIQTDAAINRGNSGGPLIDLQGRVVGINTAIFSPSGSSSGIGFAIPSKMARAVKDQLIDHGHMRRGWIGVVMGELTPELAASFDYGGGRGVLIDDVDPQGPGHAAGIRAGDIVVQLDGQPVRDMANFRNTIAQAGPEATVELQIWRSGRTQSISIALGTLPGSEQKPSPATSPPEVTESNQPLGLRFEDPDARLRRQLNLSTNEGAVIAGVKSGSIADDLGLRVGDIVLQIAGQRVRGAADTDRRLRQADLDRGVRVRVRRGPYGRFIILRRPSGS